MSKILIVEDNPLKHDALAMVLSHEGHAVSHAWDGIEGLVRAHEEQPDLIIADMIMPRMDGYDFCKALCQDPRLNHIPIVINSVMDEAKVRLLAEACDIHYFIPMAAKRQEILDIVGLALEHKADPPLLDTQAITLKLEDVLAELRALSAKLPPAS